MDAKQLTETAQRASERYVNFLQGLRGLLSTVLQRDPSDIRTRTELRSAAFEIARTYIATEVGIIEDMLTDHTLEEATRLFESVGDLVGDLEDFAEEVADSYIELLETEIRAQVERDIQQLLRRLKDHQNEVALIAITESVDSRTAQVRAMFREREAMRFYFKDRAGRKFLSQKFIRTVWRDALLQSGNEAFMKSAATAGIVQVAVEHPESKASADGRLITLNSALIEGETYPDIRDEIFHPNSMARLVI